MALFPDYSKCGKGASCAYRADNNSPDTTTTGDNNNDNLIRHSDRPDNDCAFNPGLGKCKADCTEDQSFCKCPRGFVMNEDDHCRPDKKCPKGFKEHANDETGTCFPTKTLLRGGGTGATTKPKTVTTTINNQFTVPQGFNATFFDINTPYCWYVVNAPPCYDIKNGSVIR
jgi:hypothetical protein